MCVAHALALAALAVAPPAAALEASRPRRMVWAELDRAGSTALFGRSLAPWGEWLQLADGRRAWRPTDVGSGWQPYQDGSWAWTAEGWYWVSSEPWAWATYHYGRWRVDERLGWIWLPGVDWAPAWVVWRYAPDAVGWAPRSDDGVVPPASWVFLPASRFAGVDASAAVPLPRRAALFAASRRPADGSELARGPRPARDSKRIAGVARGRRSLAGAAVPRLEAEPREAEGSSPPRAHDAGR